MVAGSAKVRYCGEVVGDTYCNAILIRSKYKVNGHYEGVCPQCGRYYLSYGSCSSEAKTSLPRLSLLTTSKNRASALEAEVARLVASKHKGTFAELRALAQKTLAYASSKTGRVATTESTATAIAETESTLKDTTELCTTFDVECNEIHTDDVANESECVLEGISTTQNGTPVEIHSESATKYTRTM